MTPRANLGANLARNRTGHWSLAGLAALALVTTPAAAQSNAEPAPTMACLAEAVALIHGEWKGSLQFRPFQSGRLVVVEFHLRIKPVEGGGFAVFDAAHGSFRLGQSELTETGFSNRYIDFASRAVAEYDSTITQCHGPTEQGFIVFNDRYSTTNAKGETFDYRTRYELSDQAVILLEEVKPGGAPDDAWLWRGSYAGTRVKVDAPAEDGPD